MIESIPSRYLNRMSTKLSYRNCGCCGRDSMVVGFITTYVQSVPITTNVVSSNPAHGQVYSVQYHVIKFVNDLRQVGDFLRVLRFLLPIN